MQEGSSLTVRDVQLKHERVALQNVKSHHISSQQFLLSETVLSC